MIELNDVDKIFFSNDRPGKFTISKGRRIFSDILLVEPSNCPKTYIFHSSNDNYGWFGAEKSKIVLL